MVVLNSSEAEGTLYVETKNLDGETNLKTKSVAKELISPFNHEATFGQVSGTLNVEAPNNRIYKFDGNFDLTEYSKNRLGAPDSSANSDFLPSIVPLSTNNVVLRGMSLRNTEHITGIVVYTGHDSKIQMNSAGTVYKTSNIMHVTNKQILLVFVIQIFASAIGSALGTTWTIQNLEKVTYLDINKDDEWNSSWFLLFIQKTGTWILIFT